MRNFSEILILTTMTVFLTLSFAFAGSTFVNKDTAKNRKNNSFGTEQGEGTGTNTFGTNEDGETTIRSKARPKAEEVDWYDKVIITVNPDTKWPQSGSTTTTSTGYNNATDVETTTTTTQEYK